MNFVMSFIKGLFIGAGAILPGISSGVFCVIFGIYDKIVESVLYFFEDIKKNFIFLFPIILGCVFGIILFGNILMFLFNNYTIQTKFAFMGLILGCIPSLFKIANSKSKAKLNNIIYLLLSFGISISLLYFEKSINIYSINTNSFLYLLFSGIVMSSGIVVPGISSSVFLMILGIYNDYLEAISNINLYFLFPLGLGVILGGFLFLKIIQICFNRYFSATYYSIIGFVLGSVFILYNPIHFDFIGISSLGLFIIFFLMAFNFEKIKR